jgi:alanyl-tRNA synthetase
LLHPQNTLPVLQESHALETQVMDLKEAKESGAIAMFGEKYDSEVRVVNVPGVSKELCGGTHVTNTSEIGGFKIVSEAGIASGVRRIEAVSGPSLMPFVDGLNRVVQEVAASLKVSTGDIPARVATMQKELFAREKEITALKSEVAMAKSMALVTRVRPCVCAAGAPLPCAGLRASSSRSTTCVHQL